MKKWVIFALILIAGISTVFASTFHFDESRTGNFDSKATSIPGLEWRANLTGLIDASPVYSDGKVYVSNWYGWGSWRAGLYCVNASTGEIEWVNENISGASTPTIQDDFIFIGDVTGKLYCINKSDGREVWNITLEKNPGWYGIASSPLFYNNTIYVTTFSEGVLHAIDLNGDELWNVTTGEISPYTSPSAYDGKIFFAGYDGLYCLDESGNKIWRFDASNITNTPSAGYDKVFFATTDTLYAVDISGNEVWNVSLNGTMSTAAVGYGNVYIGTKDGEMMCFNASSGIEVWNFTANGKIDSSPALSNGVVYFATNTPNGTIYALNASDGELIWGYSLNPPSGSYYNIMSSPFIAGNRLFIGADDGFLYCFGPIIWEGSVELSPVKVRLVFKDGREGEINGTTVLAALLKASEKGGFNVTVVDTAWGPYVESIADIQAEGLKGWMYTVNGNMPSVGASDYELNDGDTVEFYYGSWNENAEKADYRIIIHTNLTNVIWSGSIKIAPGSFYAGARSGKIYEIENITALGALNAASIQGNFTYTINDEWYESFGALFVDSIYGINNSGTSGWMYWVNYPDDPMPSVGSDRYLIKDGDRVYWYYYEKDGDNPINSRYVIKIDVRADRAFIEAFNVSEGRRGGNATAWVKVSSLNEGWYVVVVSGTGDGESISGISTVHMGENENITIPVIINVPQQVHAGNYTLHAGIYALESYPNQIINWTGSKSCEVR